VQKFNLLVRVFDTFDKRSDAANSTTGQAISHQVKIHAYSMESDVAISRLLLKKSFITAQSY